MKTRQKPKLIPPKKWDSWLTTLFPSAFTVPNSPYHDAFWEWAWAIKPDHRPRPYVFILSRGGGKTTCGEITPIMIGARKVRKYAWYIQETQDQADKRIVNIADKLESEIISQYYPLMSERKIGKFGSSRGWRRSYVQTASDFIVEAVGLDRAARSSKVGDARPDLLIIDDIDSKHDTIAAVQKKIDTLTHTLLPAATANAAIVFIQNLMHLNSVASKLSLKGGTAEFLTDRIVSGPYPALYDFEYEIATDEEVGRPSTVITNGIPVWQGQDVETCQKYIKTFGITSFKVECQHDVEDQSGGVWDEIAFDHVFKSEVPPIIAGAVWVDPAVTSKDSSDCQGIQADGLGDDGIIYRFQSYEQRTTPEKVLTKAVLWAIELGFETVGVETIQGGDTWKTVYTTVCKRLVKDPLYPHIGSSTKFPKYHEAKGSMSHGSKVFRNSLMLADYEMGQVSHVYGGHKLLESALKRFPKFAPDDLSDAAYYGWAWLRNGLYKKKTAAAH